MNPSLRRFGVGRMWRTSLPPVLIGLVAFSFTTLAFGASVYVAAVPALIKEIPVHSSALSDAEGKRDGASADDSSGTDYSATVPKAENANVSSPASTNAESNSRIEAEFSSPVSPESASTPPVGGVNDDPPLSTAPPAEEKPKPGENLPSEEITPEPPQFTEEEKKIYSNLTWFYDNLPRVESDVTSCGATFNTSCNNGSMSARRAHLQFAMQIREQLGEAKTNLAMMDVPEDSRYHHSYNEIVILYDDLGNYMLSITKAWMLNVSYENPSEHKDFFMGPINADLVDGKNRYLTDFRNRYPGARP